MPTSLFARPVTSLALAAALVASLGACGEVHAPDARAGAASTGSTPSDTSSSSAPGASPYVEPGAGDGAPHYNENNAYRREGDMTAAHAKDAQREADRLRPVLERLWERRKWDPETVRTALLRLGYEEERVTQDGKRLGGTLTVTAMSPRWKDDGYVTPEGTRVALRVHDDACVSGFVQKPDFEVRAHGPYPETGCLEPPYGH
ncbi:hypothetical protein ADK65_02760 [Streptomyces sp. NRRL B-1140]|uniref:hypothetical protein n=1 Tax=Streptomyces sp. NRRL B-1140 TaxID=1415549 RepID=UPI0006AE2A3F|nr:hypothetical protein [Streptomyces sp. NRRL B-1140]KOX06139.1 hypothetical protein ADK65_02760 [Streptomyces sp. NRRL B-1140]